MRLDSVSVYIPDVPGAMAGVMAVLRDETIPFHAFTLDSGHVHILTREGYDAEAALRRNGYNAVVMEMQEVPVPDEPGVLADLFDKLAEKSINVKASFGTGDGTRGRIYIRVDEVEAARPILDQFAAATV